MEQPITPPPDHHHARPSRHGASVPSARRSPPWCACLLAVRQWIRPARAARQHGPDMQDQLVPTSTGRTPCGGRPGADALLVCGDLVNLIDYRTMEGIAADVFGPEATRDFVPAPPGGSRRPGGSCAAPPGARRRSATWSGRPRAQYEAVFAAFPEPTYLTHGNVDRPEQFQDLLRPGVRHLDGESVEVDGLRVGFVGGGLRGAAGRTSRRSATRRSRPGGRPRPGRRTCPHMPPAIDDLCFDVVGPARAGQPGPARLRGGAPARLPASASSTAAARPLRIGRTWLVNVGYLPPGGCWSIRPDGVLGSSGNVCPGGGRCLILARRQVGDAQRATPTRHRIAGVVDGAGRRRRASWRWRRRSRRARPRRRDGARQAEVPVLGVRRLLWRRCWRHQPDHGALGTGSADSRSGGLWA